MFDVHFFPVHHASFPKKRETMDNLPQCFGVIPARFDSSRFPGKALADINGKPMFWHVYTRAGRCPYFSRIVLATDDQRIFSAAEKLSVPVMMTQKTHPSGTDRVLEAAEKLNAPANAVIVNIQGDEPLLEPEMLGQLIRPFASDRVQVTTLAQKIDSTAALNPDRVKVVLAKDGHALYFSRAPIPCHRDGSKAGFLGHIGLYAFKMATLRRFQQIGRSRLESIESLEQLRLLEEGIDIHVVITEHATIGVDRPEDLQKVLHIMKKESRK
jgi:3-deoxy-manno-octulosonate cytidylyltransferase (CMP-KDO synthetase)